MAKELSRQNNNEREWEKSSNWRYGIFYYSEKDGRAWVPKRSMFGRRRYGGTPNFAHPAGRGYFMLVIGVCVLFLLVVIALDRSGVFK